MARDQTAPLNTMQYLSKQAHEWTALELFTIFIVPFLAFVTASLLIVFLYEWLPGTTLIILILLFCASLGLFWRGLKDPQRAADYYVGALTGIAMVLGCLVGITAFRWYFFPYYLTAEYNSFTHVLPSNPSEGYADAGKMVFVDEARVDSQLSMGYKDGGLYCVAPVMDEVTASEVGFWAVGQDCCSARGNFVCDDAWNTDARAAIVVRQDDSLFGAGIFERYMKAVRQAEAAYEITASAHPVFVRWVLNPSEVQANYQREGYGLLAVMWAIYLVVSIIVTFFINTKKKNFQMAGRDDRGSRKTLGTEADAESGRPGNTLVPSDSRRSHGTTMRYS